MTKNTETFTILQKPIIKLLSQRYIYSKLLFIYVFLYTVAFALGAVFLHALKPVNNTAINAHIDNFFSIDISQCKNVFDLSKLLLNISSTYILHLTIVFFAGFTLIVGISITLLLIIKGFSLGFSVSYLSYAVNNNIIVLEHPIAAVFLYSAISTICVVITIHFCVKTAFFSDEFKSLCGLPRRIIKSKALYLQIFRFLIAFGAILILNLISCIL